MTKLNQLLDALVNGPPGGSINLETLKTYAEDLGNTKPARQIKALIDHVQSKPALDSIPDRHLQFLGTCYRQFITTLAILCRAGLIDMDGTLTDEHVYHLDALEIRMRQLEEFATA
jgi:hypothetical protein